MSYMGNIYLAKDLVIKVNSETLNYVYGFNIETEEPVRALKKTLVPLQPAILSIIRSQRVQLLVTESILYKQTGKRISVGKIAPVMNLSERSLFRLMAEEDIHIGKYENCFNRIKK